MKAPLWTTSWADIHAASAVLINDVASSLLISLSPCCYASYVTVNQRSLCFDCPPALFVTACCDIPSLQRLLRMFPTKALLRKGVSQAVHFFYKPMSRNGRPSLLQTQWCGFTDMCFESCHEVGGRADYPIAESLSESHNSEILAEATG